MNPTVKFVCLTTVVIFAFVPSGCESYSGEDDLVRSFPYYTGDYSQVGHYAGFLKADSRTHLYYWFFRAQSDNWQKEPVVMFLKFDTIHDTSLHVPLTVFGPLKLNQDYTLSTNPTEFGWNQKANLLYIDTPVFVGYSYQSGPVDSQTSDTETAKHNQGAISDFFSKFPQLANNDFYLFGQGSSCLMLFPLGALLVEHKYPPNFKGFMLESAFFDVFEDPAQLEQASKAGLIDQSHLAHVINFCCPANFCSFAECFHRVNGPCELYWPNDPECCETFDVLMNDLYSWVNWADVSKVANETNRPNYKQIKKWFRLETVRQALKVSSNEWHFVSKVPHHYDITVGVEHVRTLLNSGIRALLYYGESDFKSGHLNAQWLLDDLREDLTRESNSAFEYDGRAAGHQQRHLFHNKTQITFVVLYNASNFAVLDQPGPVFKLFSDFVSAP